MITQERLGLGSWNFIGTLIMTRRWPLLILRSLGQRSRSQVKVTVTGNWNRHFKDLAWFKQGKQLPFMHVLFVTAFASLVIYLNFTKCKANCIFVMHCINKPRAKMKLRLHQNHHHHHHHHHHRRRRRRRHHAAVMSVCRSVGRSVRPPGGFRMITQERLGLGSWNFIGTLIMTCRWPLSILEY